MRESPELSDLSRIQDGVEMARGAMVSAFALLTANLRAIFTFLIARLLGKVALGSFALAYSALDLLLQIATFGLDTGSTPLIAQRFAVGDLAGGRRLFHRVVLLGLGISSATAVFAIVALQLFGERFDLSREWIDATSVIFLAVPGIVVYRISNAVSRGMKVVRHEIYSRGLTETFSTIVALLIAIALGLRLMAPVVAVIVGTACGAVVAARLASQLFTAAKGIVGAAPETGSILRFSGPIAVYSLLNILVMRLDILLLGLWVNRAPGVTLASIGIYAACVEIAGGLRKINQIFTPLFTSIMAVRAVGDDDRAHMIETFARLERWVLALVVPSVAVLGLAGGLGLRIFGPGFEDGRRWLALLAIASGTNAFVALAETVILVRHPTMNMVNSAVTAGASIAINVWLIPRFGLFGAALGMIIPYLLNGFLRYGELRVFYHWRRPWRPLLKPLALAAVAVVPAIALRWWMPGWPGELAAGLTFLVLYLVGWRVTGVDESDREILARMWPRSR